MPKQLEYYLNNLLDHLTYSRTMTTKKFSAITLRHPKNSMEIGCLDLRQTDLNLPKWIPRFSDLAQLIEVRETGFASITRSRVADETDFFGSYIVIDNARPELFLRRDFISKFVEQGTVHLVQVDRGVEYKGLDYQMQTSSNVLTIVMDEKQYRRFGLVAKKVISKKKTTCTRYQIDIDLNDQRIKKSNKYQDRLIATLRRLNPIKKLYFRYAASDCSGLSESEANDKCLEFFRYVINEYAMDGFQPVPLTGVSKFNQKIDRRWSNRSQRHPSLDLRMRG